LGSTLEIHLVTLAATNRRFIRSNICVFFSLRFVSEVTSLPVSVIANSTGAGALLTNLVHAFFG